MWADRLREAVYESPSGVRSVLGYEAVSEVMEKKTTAFDFPDADGTYIQDLGPKGRRYPFRIFFWGNDYDLEAERFSQSLLEKGAGRLEHPLYGIKTVVPFGTIRRRDDLVSAANQAVFDIEFWETTDLIYPSGQTDIRSSAKTSLGSFQDAQAKEFSLQDRSTAIQRISIDNQILSNLSALQESLGFSNIPKFDDQLDLLARNVGVMNPLDAGSSILELFQAAAQPNQPISSFQSSAPRSEPVNKNEFLVDDIFSMGSIAASITSVLSTQFISRGEALLSADNLLNNFEKVNDERENILFNLDLIDSGEAYQNLQESISLTAGYLVELSFSLAQERVIILDRNRTIIDVCAELYGEVDSKLDFFIDSNNIAGGEILELKKGREILYYV